MMKNQNLQPLLALIALSTVHSCAQIFSHNAILFIDTSDNVWYKQVHWSYLSIIASNVTNTKSVKSNMPPCPWSKYYTNIKHTFFLVKDNLILCLMLGVVREIYVCRLRQLSWSLRKVNKWCWNVEGQLFVLSVVIELGSLGKPASCLLHWTNYFCVVQLCKLEIPNRENDSVSYSW